MVIGLKNDEIFCSKLNAIFTVVKIKLGSELGAWVSFHSAILQSWKFQENLGRTVVALLLWVRNIVPSSGSCHKRQKPQAPTPHAPIRNRQTRKVANAKGLNCNTNLT